MARLPDTIKTVEIKVSEKPEVNKMKALKDVLLKALKKDKDLDKVLQREK